jgi:hypothetical protein
MRPKPALGHMRAARGNVRSAIQICGTADLTELRRALDLLTATASEMRLAEAAILTDKPGEPGELRREAALLKREVACLMRVIDGCAALYRGLSVRLGCAALTYSPQGRAIENSSAAAACEMQG